MLATTIGLGPSKSHHERMTLCICSNIHIKRNKSNNILGLCHVFCNSVLNSARVPAVLNKNFGTVWLQNSELLAQDEKITLRTQRQNLVEPHAGLSKLGQCLYRSMDAWNRQVENVLREWQSDGIKKMFWYWYFYPNGAKCAKETTIANVLRWYWQW